MMVFWCLCLCERGPVCAARDVCGIVMDSFLSLYSLRHRGKKPICGLANCHNTVTRKDASGQIMSFCSVRCQMQHQMATSGKLTQHCALPGCNRTVWPLMDFCGKTHAEQAAQMGILGTFPLSPVVHSRPILDIHPMSAVTGWSHDGLCGAVVPLGVMFEGVPPDH